MSKPLLQALFAMLLVPVMPALAQQGNVPNTLDTIAQRVAACTACHGKKGRAGSDDKPAGYLYNHLVNFREGKHAYLVMTAMLDNMPDTYLREIAQYCADQHPPYPPPQTTQAILAELERGRLLVHESDKARGIPAYIACHGAKLTGTALVIPGLIGQIGAWKIGTRHAAQPDCMTQIVQKMRSEDINATTA